MVRAISTARLLRWYDANRRELPWRETRDPYRIWLSEIMLQQTQVQTVIPYYETFTEYFPDVDAMAASPVEDILALWSGLGYYRRARYMHAAAVKVSEAGGHFPRSAEKLQTLPGIGAYTAAAIASIAFDEPVAVLDGNVERVLCRILALDGDPKKATIRQQLQAVAAASISPERPGDTNQAMMELGATVCRPRQAACEICPLREECQGLAQGRVESLPTPRRRRAVEKVRWLIALVRDRRGRVLLFRRSEAQNLMGGLWELPTISAQRSQAANEAQLSEAYGGSWKLIRKVGEIKHAITYRSIQATVLRAEVTHAEDVSEGIEAAWVGSEDWDRFAVSSMVEKALELDRGE